MGKVPVSRIVEDPTTREDPLAAHAVPWVVNAAVWAQAAAATRAAQEARRRSAFMVTRRVPRRAAPFASSKKSRAPDLPARAGKVAAVALADRVVVVRIVR